MAKDRKFRIVIIAKNDGIVKKSDLDAQRTVIYKGEKTILKLLSYKACLIEKTVLY